MYPTRVGISCYTLHVKTDKGISLCRQTSAPRHSCHSVSGVFECCHVLRRRPPREEHKTSFYCTFQYILPSSEANLLAVPFIQCLCGDILMTWNILSLSSKPALPSARFHLGYFLFFFCFSPYPWESALSACTTSRRIVLLSLNPQAPFTCPCLVRVQRLVCCKSAGPRVTTSRVFVCDLGYVSTSRGFGVPLWEVEDRFFHTSHTSLWPRTQFAKVG